VISPSPNNRPAPSIRLHSKTRVPRRLCGCNKP
jgi:hypothetical protein